MEASDTMFHTMTQQHSMDDQQHVDKGSPLPLFLE